MGGVDDMQQKVEPSIKPRMIKHLFIRTHGMVCYNQLLRGMRSNT